jgi:cell wall-associated NlpC family hydrolase
MLRRSFLTLAVVAGTCPAEVAQSTPPEKSQPLPGALDPGDVADFSKVDAAVAPLLTEAMRLSKLGLGYQYGSADPAKGGMDCSGAVYHVLQGKGWGNCPRQSDQMYAWAWKAGTFRAVNGRTRKSWEFAEIRPGDLLFWTNTTGKSDREPPVTHVMIFLGREKKSGREVMFGSSDGRTYDGKARWGVGVFDFVLPKESSQARFIGYAHLPAKAKK